MDSLGGMMGGVAGAGGTGGGFWGGLANATSSFNNNYNASKGGSPVGAPLSKNQQTAADPQMAELEGLLKKYFPQQTQGIRIDYTAAKPTGSSGRTPFQFEP